MTPATPAPGSPEAAAAGCTCRRWEGDIYAEGINLPPQHVIWWEFTNCPLHGTPAQDDDPIGDDLYRHADKPKPAGKENSDAS